MKYNNNSTFLDINEFNKQYLKIKEYRKDRNNIFIYYNNGYKKSIPFLCYYLIKFHKNEVTNVERAIDIILP
jgi:hypothetical protein